MRVMIDICYDGSCFEGFAPQSHNRTVTASVEETLLKIYKQPITIYGTSRTDSGVCANTQFIVFDQPFKIADAQLVKALNAALSPTIYCKRSMSVPPGYMPRHDVISKTYSYTLAKNYNPLFRHTQYHVRKPMDYQQMKKAASYLVGTHDFSSFCAANSSVSNKVRTITAIDVIAKDGCIEVRVSGDGFLYNMVRIIVGTLIVIGIGKAKPESMQEILEQRDRRYAYSTAPASGLILEKIILKEYDESWGLSTEL